MPEVTHVLKLVHGESPEHKLRHAFRSRHDGDLECSGYLICVGGKSALLT